MRRKRVVVTSRERDSHPSGEGFCVNASNPCSHSTSGVRARGKEYGVMFDHFGIVRES